MNPEQPVLPAHLTTLAWGDRQVLEDRLLAFDQGWHETRLAEAMNELPSDHGLRRAALLEMIKIDLERQWQRGRQTTLQHYLDNYPELGCAADLPPDLVRAEAEVQRQFNNQSETRPPSALFATLPVSFGRYRILKMLGQGAMGSVFLAHDPVLDRDVALKVPHFGPVDGPETLARFTREAQAVSRLHHPNVCPVYDAGVCEQLPFITMAYLDGKPLSDELAASGPWPSAKALRLIHKLALALQAAHAQGVLHRDLKPANVMLNAAGEPVLTDFGLARRWQQNDVRLTFPGSIVGTPAYMAPEQIAGTTATLGPACDVYGLGVILYELLTGKLPFSGSLADVLVRIATVQPTPPSTLRPELNAALDDICLRALAKDPAARFRDMNDFADALNGALASLEKPAAAIPAKKRGHRIALVAGFLVLVGVGWWIWRELDLGSHPVTPPVQTTQLPPPATVVKQQSFSWVEAFKLPGHNGEVAALAFTDGGKRAVSFGADGMVRWWDLSAGAELQELRLELSKNYGTRILSADGRYLLGGIVQIISMWDLPARKVLRQLSLAGPHLGGLAFSGDGGRILAGGQKTLGQPFLQVWDTESGQSIALWEENHHEWIKRVALSSDGRLALAADKGGVRLWEVDAAKQLRMLPRDLVTAMAFLPDGKHFVLGEATGAVLLYDVHKDDPPRRFAGHTAAIRCLAVSPDGNWLFTGSDDGTVRVWELATSQNLAVLKHAAPVTCLALAINERTVAVGIREGAIHLWHIK